MPKLVRKVEDKEKLKKLKEIRGVGNQDLTKKQKEIDPNILLRRAINLKLFKITAQNFESITAKIKEDCKEFEKCKVVVDILVKKAWN